jgi:type IV pilus assembly protein PilC
MLINATQFFSEWWWAILLFIALVVGILFAVFGGERGKERRDETLLRLPVVGPLVRLVAVERFCRVLAALTYTGVNLPDAVQVAADSTNNRVFQTKVSVAREAMMRGEGLARPLQMAGIFPPAARQMIRVGESTGSLDVQLQSAAVFYERELKYRLKRTTDMFEPAIILIVGGAVAFVAVAQISAMYSIYNQVDV